MERGLRRVELPMLQGKRFVFRSLDSSASVRVVFALSLPACASI